MKKILLLTVLLLSSVTSAWSQTEVHLIINHRLGNNALSSSQTASNNLGDQFKIQRLDYYIAEITLYHDGGQETQVNDHYLLVKAVNEGHLRTDSLGVFSISQLDSIRFGIGVDGSRNHADISTYDPKHPLSYQSPSMHWGWSAGYRFVAIEGVAGPSMNQAWQLHGLGDNNYGYTTVVTSGNWNGNILSIAINGDYEKTLKNMNVDGSLIYHGSSSHAVTLLDNFKNEVFSAGSGSLETEDYQAINWQLYPNPSSGVIHVKIPEGEKAYHVEIRDLSGQLIERKEFSNTNSLELDLQQSGLYMVSLYQDNALVDTQRLIVQ